MTTTTTGTYDQFLAHQAAPADHDPATCGWCEYVAGRTVDCPACAGAGRLATTQDYWGNWDDVACGYCQEFGAVTAEDAAAYDPDPT